MKPFIQLTIPDSEFKILYKVIQTEGFIAYEYNPFRNLRLSDHKYIMNNGKYLYNPTGSEGGLKPIELEVWDCSDLQHAVKTTINITNFNIDKKYYLTTGNSYIQNWFLDNEESPEKDDDGISRSKIRTYSQGEMVQGGKLVLNDKKKYSPREIFKPLTAADSLRLKNEGNSSTVDNGSKFQIESYKGDLVDFTTKNISLNLNNPVDIEIQESYDGSVNLILNNDLNIPKIINSRFTVLEDGRYRVVDRKGDNDSNIYDEDNVISETSLYKNINKLPRLYFRGVSSGGNLKVGNYVFYFKYVDSDGNETDFVTESGIVSVLIGNYLDPTTTRGALDDINAYKLVLFDIYNVDEAYDYITVYYSRSTGNEYKSEATTVYKVLYSFPVIGGSSKIVITGLESVQEITQEELNVTYNVVSKVKSQAQVQNRLFFGNVDKPSIPYEELEDLSLRITASLSCEEDVGYLTHEYEDDLGKFEYYNTDNIYYRTGYWEDIYQFGIVYIMPDFTLSPVFPIRGGEITNDIWNYYPIYEQKDENLDPVRKYIHVREDQFIDSGGNLENAKGVIRIDRSGLEKTNFKFNNRDGITPIGIKFSFQKVADIDNDNLKGPENWSDSNKKIEVDLITELKKHTRGFFFVRKKRIPTVYCQGITIGQDLQSLLPILPVAYNNTDDTTKNNNNNFVTESFLDENRRLTNDFSPRILTTNLGVVRAAIIPEAEINPEFYSQIFNGSKFTVRYSIFQPKNRYFSSGGDEGRHYYISSYELRNKDTTTTKSNIGLTYIDDSVAFKSSGTADFSSKAGEAETAYLISYLEKEVKTKENNRILRGAWSSYTGIEGLSEPGVIFDVMISGYSSSLLENQFISRFNNDSPYYAISDRLEWDDLLYNDSSLNEDSLVCYRGDCYIGNYTHRMCRNFQDPEAPTNDIIVASDTWRDNYLGYDDNDQLDIEKMDKLNRGDINAVKIGHWATFKCMTNINFATRCDDGSNVSETVLNGHPRQFFPLGAMSPNGEYKTPDSTMFNRGLNSTTSDKFHFIVPDVPYIKNEFANRIMYSQIHVTDAFKNNYRVFKSTDYMDYNREYGMITSIVEWFSNIIVVFEHGVGLLPVNEKAQTGMGEGGPVYINSFNVLSDKVLPISKLFGSQWKDSVIKTDRFVYGVDTVAKKIWRTNGKEFELISDFRIQEFLNDNISLSERERTPLIGVRNVKTHYNRFKNDIMFTFYDDINFKDNLGNIVKSMEWNMCYNEIQDLWITQYTWLPSISENIYNVYFSYDKEDAKQVSEVAQSWGESETSYGIILKDCYTENTYYSSQIVSADKLKLYSSNVIYPGVEIPDIEIPAGQDKWILVGELGVDLHEEPSEFEYNKFIFKLIDEPLAGIEYSGLQYPDNLDFKIEQLNDLHSYLFFDSTKMSNYRNQSSGIYRNAMIRLQVELKRGSSQQMEGTKGQIYYDTLNVRVCLNRVDYDTKTWFWRHGKAGIFDNDETIYPCLWYYKERNYTDGPNKGQPKPISEFDYAPFEFEFVVNKNVGMHKIFTNLYIISNNVMPEQISFEVTGDAYEFAELKEDSYKVQAKLDIEEGMNYINFIIDNGTGEPNTILFYDKDLMEYSLRRIQPIKEMKTHGLIRGNSRYQEDIVNITLEPIKYKTAVTPNVINPRIYETRPRDKFIKIRVKYKGDKKVLITTLQTLFDLSYC